LGRFERKLVYLHITATVGGPFDSLHITIAVWGPFDSLHITIAVGGHSESKVLAH